MVLLEGISLSGEQVVAMKDKTITIAKAPRYETFTEEGKADKRKVLIEVKISEGIILTWYPNKGSLKVLAHWFGFEMDKWLNKSFGLMTAKQNVQGNMKDVIYVDETKKFS